MSSKFGQGYGYNIHAILALNTNHRSFSGFGFSQSDRLNSNEVTLSYFSGLPDPSNIYDSQYVVIFKGLLKRDSTTKERALNELSTILSASPEPAISDDVHWAWTQIYPKLSIDTSRSVRILTQRVQGKICTLLGKRSAKYLKYSIPSWIFCLYDTDRMVATTTQQSLSSVFTTPEKRESLYTVFLDHILDFIYNLIAHESVESLSDERYVSKEEAEAKYYRTLRSGIATLSHLVLNVLPKIKPDSKTVPKFSQILDDDRIWKFSYSSDVNVSRATLSLISKLFSSAEKNTWADLVKERVAVALIAKGLSSSSSFVAVDFLQALIRLTQYDPEVWNTVSSKKTPLTRLASYIKKGNKGRHEHFWALISKLLSILPASISPYSYDIDASTADKNSETIIKSAIEAVTQETGPQSVHSWGYLMAAVEKVSSASKGKNHVVIKLLYEAISETYFAESSPVIHQTELFGVIGKKTSHIFKESPEALMVELNKISKNIKPQSPPASAINYLNFFKFTIANLEKTESESLKSSLSELIQEVIELLSQDPEEPVKAKFVLEALTVFGDDIISVSDLADSYVSLVDIVFNSFDKYGTNETLLGIVGNFIKVSKNVQLVSDSLQKAQEILVSLDQSNEQLLTLLSNFLGMFPVFKGLLSPSKSLSEFVSDISAKLFKDILTPEAQTFVKNAVLAHDSLVSSATSSSVLDQLLSSVLSKDDNQETSISLLLSLLKLDQPYVYYHFQTEEGKSAVTNLWKASETHEHQTDIDALLRQLESFAVSTKVGDSTGVTGLANDIIKELGTASIEEVTLLVERAQRLIENAATSEDKTKRFEELIYTKDIWNEQLKFSFDQGLHPALSLSPIYGNSVFLTAYEELVQEPSTLLISQTLINLSVFSNAIITTFPDIFKSLSTEASTSIVFFLAYTGELIDITIDQANEFYDVDGSNRDLYDVLVAVSNDIRSLLQSFFSPVSGKPEISLGALLSTETDDKEPALSVLQMAWKESEKTDVKAFYSSRVLESLFSIISIGSSEVATDLVKKLVGKFDRNALGVYALLNSLKHSTVIDGLTNLRNNLLGALMTTRGSQLASTGIKYLVLFVSSLSLGDETKSGLAFFKLTNFLRSLSDVATGDDVFDEAYSPLVNLTAQLYEKIAVIFYKDLSLSFWEQFNSIFETGFVVATLGSPFDGSLLTSLLNYFKKLEVLAESRDEIATSLENLSPSVYELTLDNIASVEAATNRLEEFKSQALLNVLSNIPSDIEFEVDPLYSLISFEDKYLEITGLSLLKTYLSKTQKDKSISFALLKQPINPEETDVESYLLPFELLSLILDSPINKTEGQKRQFVYAWYAIFLFFENSVAALRNFYLSQLKEGGYAEIFFDFVASEIEAGLNKDNKTSWSIESIDPSIDLVGENDVERCIWNTYYQALNHLGSIAKTWFMDLKKKKLRTDVENFTKTYISSLVIRNKAETVRRALEQDTDLVDDTLEIQISKSGKVVTAYYFIDNQTMEVVFKYPDTYPLKDISFEGVQLVGAREKQWRAWILASQSALKTNGGSILDSLDLFKRNVTMHFDGVAACAICYSILHEDHTLPTKECGTCHNRFHTDCLYRWFKSGSTESCPLCRTEMSFRIGH